MTSPSPHVTETQNHPNGTPPARQHGPNKPGAFRKFGIYLWVGILLLLTASGVGALTFMRGYLVGTPYTGPTWTVKKEPLRVTIVERGSLESAENSDIIVRVKAGTKGGTTASTIKWVVDDGTQVKFGDPIVDLDDSGFQDQLKTQRNNKNTSYANWIQATNATVIQESDNVSAIKTAEVNLIKFQLELKKYAGETAGTKLMNMETQAQIRTYLANGFEDDSKKETAKAEGKLTSAYLQQVSIFEGTIETARSDKDAWLDRAAWSQRMVKKGFYSLSQSDADQSRLSSVEIALRKAQGDLDIYRIFDRESNITLKWSDVKEAERQLKKAVIQADSKMKQVQASEAAAKAVYDQEFDKLRDLEKDEKFYKITAPQSGMIVYYIPEQQRFGGGAQQGTVAQGEPVREGQKLIRIPNLAKMVVNARVHEAMVSKVRGEYLRPTGYTDALRYGMNFGRHDPIGMLAYQFGFEQYKDEYSDWREKDQTVVFPGHRAKIRIDAFPGKQYEGHVKTVATIASQAEFFSSDVKVYQTMVSIEDLDPHSDKLKPGMSAEVTILADETKEPVLVVPIQSVVGNVAMRAERKCYVLDGQGIAHERDIVVGLSNDKVVQVISGLEEGDRVVMNPRSLIPEKSDLKPGTPGSRRGAEFEDGGKKKGGFKKDGGGKGGGPGAPGGPPDAKFQRPQGAPSGGGQDRSFKKQ
ncbi:MAG TPA: hypothetical protein VFE62_08865 [Gemmataceae bacterium]|nr:hypothetical protein [Gemmataceae bacterium]